MNRTRLLMIGVLALALGPAITAALYIFFFTQVLGFSRTQTTVLLLIYIAAGLPGAPTWALIANRLGKHQTVMLGCVLYGFAQALVFVMPHGNMALMIPGMFFAGFVVSCFNFLIRAMVAGVAWRPARRPVAARPAPPAAGFARPVSVAAGTRTRKNRGK